MMRQPYPLKSLFIEVVCSLYILLFIYAAVSKILDYDTFKTQLGQSAILSPLADWLVLLVPITEVSIVALLFFKRTKFWGLYAAFVLMVLFTFYIYVILYYSAYIPCSCGGILEKMSWRQHLLFNVFFALLAGVSLLFIPPSVREAKNSSVKNIDFKFRALVLVFGILLSGISIFSLFRYSEKITHYENRFIRRFPQHVAQELYKIDLKYNSYYFAGSNLGKIYLGNSTAPFKIIEIDSSTRKKKVFQITVDEQNLPFNAPQIKILENTFYLYEGSVPYIFKGTVSAWKGILQIQSGLYFSSFQPMNTNLVALRYIVPNSGENAIGTLNLLDTLSGTFNYGLLEKQFDGVFDTDGTLLYDEITTKIIYVYFYRNEYLSISSDLKLLKKGNTIDTIRKAKIDLIQSENSTRKTFAKPPLLVNKTATVSNNLLYVNSEIPGLYESDELWCKFRLY